MSGNVWEWVYDGWYDKAYQSRTPVTVDPISDKDPYALEGDVGERVARGGSWFGEEDTCRVSYRARFSADYKVANLGFRIVRNP